MQLNKILTFFICLLCIVILIELIYIYRSTQEPQVVAKNTTENISTTNSKANWENIKNLDTLYNTINPQMALDPKVIYSHIFYKKGITESSIITNIHRGKIASIDQTTKKAFYDYYDAVFTVRIVDETNEQVGITFNLSADDLSKTTFIKNHDNEESPITASDLKVGDIIQIEDKIDAMYTIPIDQTDGMGYLTKSWGFNRINTRIIKLN